MRKLLLLHFVFLSFVLLQAQVADMQALPAFDYKKINKGKLYILVGWNWDHYTKSDIHFKGRDHDFTLYDVKAQDRNTPFSASVYLNPSRLSIPQTNLKIGYYFHHNWNLAFGLDHMKYVVENYQEVSIEGEIDGATVFDGSYQDDEITLYPSFLQYEHTDGLNYVHFEINRVDRILKTKFFDINLSEGISLGALVPRSDVVLLGGEEWDKYHLAGYGTTLKVGVNLTFFNYFHIQSELKGGFIHLPDVKTTPYKEDKASQHFFFSQHNILFGAVFPIIKKEKRVSPVNIKLKD
ncbi:MAG: hypothetical protein H6579_02875 [Chitinophagales bacterium]|nr:hypothetical protein [Chitinophagales bacterium]